MHAAGGCRLDCHVITDHKPFFATYKRLSDACLVVDMQESGHGYATFGALDKDFIAATVG